MRPSDNIRKLFKELHVPTSATLDEKINFEIVKLSEEVKSNKPAISMPRIWRIIMSAPSEADVNKLDNPAWPKVNHQARTELCA